MRIASLLPWHAVTLLQAQAQSLGELPAPKYNEANDRGDNGFYPTRDFKTLKTDVKTPVTNFLKWDPRCDDGLRYFITPRGYSIEKDAGGPMILDSRGELVWLQHYENHLGGQAYNLMVQPYKGEDHLTFWVGEDRVRGHGAGYYYLVNSSYDLVQKVAAQRLWADLHEFLITDDNTALVSAYNTIHRDLSKFRTSEADIPESQDSNYVWDNVIQEIDLRTHQLKWQWRAAKHIDLEETYRAVDVEGTKKNPYDWCHLNSAQKDELGNYVLSARFLHSIIYVHGRTGKIIWRLGGKSNNFMDLSGGNATNFAWQHDARFHPLDSFPKLYTPPPKRPGFTTKLLTLFDNASENQHYEYGLPLSRGLLLEVTYPTPGTKEALAGPQKVVKDGSEYEGHEAREPPGLNTQKMNSMNGSDPNYTVRVIMSYENPNRIRSSSQGNMQLIPQGPGQDPKVLVGYGLAAAWTEFASNGTVLCDVHFGAKTSFESGEIQSYRVFKLPWTGKPSWKPKVVLDGDIFVSWLGATNVAEWVLQYSLIRTRDKTLWKEFHRVRKTQFEETVTIPNIVGSARYFRAIALDTNGEILENGISDPVERGVLAAHVSNWKHQLSRKFALPMLLQICMILACPAGLYAVYRRYFSRRTGRHDHSAAQMEEVREMLITE